MDIEKLIEEGYRRPDHELEDYFRKLYEEFNDDPRIVYEYANVLDYLGKEREAIPLYREALRKGVSGKRHDMCLVQLASSLRLVGDFRESYEILSNLFHGTKEPSSLLFLSLTLVSLNKMDEAFCLMFRYILGKNEGFLEDYRRALTQYIDEICKNQGNI
ncbi:tetratricopeptide repeat protein [Metallosphaera hakonensis]|uniref:Tetratrico peptide repeat group 5 domain-containing protein n=1 Tax=Metallosphaera hakonensis JCM 8857 = DSM 7519 TaxID=1293036 RepID=A0A2U9IR84_9CREN|nr:tetratricopeptide repeat protein [Metallosphaera hakonensis]AWR98530.1 tetratricopeptide repeat protein [Metallosphaera hakonensis JCM 8857 = DSM 7519]